MINFTEKEIRNLIEEKNNEIKTWRWCAVVLGGILAITIIINLILFKLI